MDDDNTYPLVQFAAEIRDRADVLERTQLGFSKLFLEGLSCLHDRLREHVAGSADPVLRAMILRPDTPTEAHTWREAAQAIERMAFEPGWRAKVLDGREDKLLSISEAPKELAKLKIIKSEMTIRRWVKREMPTLPPLGGKKRGRRAWLSDLLAWEKGEHPKQQQHTQAPAV